MTTQLNNERHAMNLLNCSLPVTETTTILDILTANNLPFRVPENDDSSFLSNHYNCWGFVAFNLKWEKAAHWVSRSAMEEHLKAHTMPISMDEVTLGDVAVFRTTDDILTHTALMTSDKDIICHKRGSKPLCIDTMENAKDLYGGVVSFVRPIR